jgi:hypothetical protein
MSELVTPDYDPAGTWSSRLTYQDRQRLRAIVRRHHLAHYPQHMLTDKECDKLLDAWGPRAGEMVIKQALRRGLTL